MAFALHRASHLTSDGTEDGAVGRAAAIGLKYFVNRGPTFGPMRPEDHCLISLKSLKLF
jgi:hypothetical protein